MKHLSLTNSIYPFSRSLVSLLTCLLIYSSTVYGNNRSHSLDKSRIKENLQKVADRQLDHFEYAKEGHPAYLHDSGINAWTNAVLYIGLLEWAKIADDKSYYCQWLSNIGKESNWKLAENFVHIPSYERYHADEFCMGQFYLEIGKLFQDENMIKATQERIDWVLNNPPKQDFSAKNKKVWSWCDALFMAPAVYSRLSEWTKDEKYLRFMDKQFKMTCQHLYDKKEHLFFRDGNYLNKKEKNGKKLFWGRGNGWVAAGLVNILKSLSPESPYRSFYENLFKELVPRLVELQDDCGFWHASLLDAASYPFPETSASALITYSIAFGIRQNLLPEKEYLPALEKSWNALLSAIDENGKLGWVQPIGAAPESVTKTMTAAYGVGAFLLAGTEIYRLLD
jgi:rhamnogalacturonyl hydrolase YesR